MTGLSARERPLRIVLDVNLLVSKAKADRAGRSNTAVQRLLGCFGAGNINHQPIQLLVSLPMLDTYQRVLERLDIDRAAAEFLVRSIARLMRAGPEQLDPLLVLGGTPDPSLKDTEDGGVLATAFAGRADFLITDNLKDFAAPASEIFRTTRLKMKTGDIRQLSCQFHQRPDGQQLVVAHPVDFIRWVDRRMELNAAAVKAFVTASAA